MYCFWKLSLYIEANTFCFQMNKDKINNENKDMKGYSPQENDEIISKKMIEERNKMIERAILSGRKHGMLLKKGRENPGKGDCILEAAIFNNNDRECFPNNYKMPINFYRRIWATDMMNRTLYSPWNSLGHDAWIKGWQDMLIPGTYERGIFGDMMVPAFACGLKKKILIFNTNENYPHDPISVIGPSSYDVIPDSEIPITLAYNMWHYESIEPCGKNDIQETINLVKKYEAGNYEFSRKDFPYLFNKQMPIHKETEETNRGKLSKNSKRTLTIDEEHDFQNMNFQLGNVVHQHKNVKKQEPKLPLDRKSQPEVMPIIKKDNITKETINGHESQLFCTSKDGPDKIKIKKEDGKFECPFCKIYVKNLLLHFNRNTTCKQNVEMAEFRICFEN